MNKRIAISGLLTRLSVTIFLASLNFSVLLQSYLGEASILVAQTIAILLAALGLMGNLGKIKLTYVALIVIQYIPFLYRNAYIEDGKYNTILRFVLSLTFACLLSMQANKPRLQKVLLRNIILFSTLNSIFTIFGALARNQYVSLMSVVLKNGPTKTSLLKNFNLYKQNLGLTYHYSQNGIITALGIISSITVFKQEKSKGAIVALILSAIAFLAIGKRGHLIALAIALIFAYLVYKKVKLKSIIKALLALAVAALAIFMISLKVPQLAYTIERLTSSISESGNENQFSSGRYEMYSDAIELRKNANAPIGWGQYAKSTNYVHPGLHNDYLQTYIETGIIGTILLIVPNIYLFVFFIKNNKNNYILFLLIFNIFIYIHALTGLPRYDLGVYPFILIANSLMIINKNRSNNEKR